MGKPPRLALLTHVSVASTGPRGWRMELTGSEAGRLLASAWMRPQREPAQGSCWAGMVSTPWPGPARVEGAALAGPNAMLVVPCADCSGLEHSLGLLQMVPTREVDLGVASVLSGSPRRGAAEDGSAHAQLGFRGSLELFLVDLQGPGDGWSLFASGHGRGLRQGSRDLLETSSFLATLCNSAAQWG